MVSKRYFKKLSLIFTGVIFCFCVVLILVDAGEASATAYISVSPQIIDIKVSPRDTLKINKTLTLETNSSNYKLDIYALVNNLDPISGWQPFLGPSVVDKTTSLANWITIKRGVIEAPPGKQKLNIDFSIEVDTFAKPGIYHAIISFGANGSNSTQVMINLEILEDSQEYLLIKKFVASKPFFYKLPASFSYELENKGNRSLTPKGLIRIYDRRGQEVASITSNTEAASIEPGKVANFASTWIGLQAFGRYKAVLTLQYGEKILGNTQDIIFFYVLIWWKVLIIFAIISLLLVCLTYILHRQYEKNN